MRFIDRSIALAATIVVASTILTPAHAQLIKSGEAYYMTGDFTLKTKVINNEIFVGKDTTFKTLPGTMTLTLASGVIVLEDKSPKGTYQVQVGDSYFGVNVFGKHRVDAPRASISIIASYDASTVNLGGGPYYNINSWNNSTINLSNASVFAIFARNASTLNLGGGTIDYASGNDKSKTNISGGTFPNGFILEDPTATANFVGKGLSFKYGGYHYSDRYGKYVDTFQVSGTFGDAKQTYDLHITNAAGAGGTENAKPRQFTFNGVSPVPVRPGTIRRNR
ncbi:MAG: hypothetical protein H7Y38_11525 [Armatimonadetes bacterium]|nr:hypothetical protein [Armatimonadota bacterium]